MPSTSTSSALARTSEYGDESLPGWERPSVWYLTGFLVPSGTPAAERADDDADDDLDAEVPERPGLPEESAEQGKRAKRRFFPSSMGLSFLVRPGARSIRVTVTWGDYRRAKREDWAGKPVDAWVREPRAETIPDRDWVAPESQRLHTVPDSGGLVLHIAERPIPTEGLGGQIETGTRAVSVFLVNDRPLASDPKDADETYAFPSRTIGRMRSSVPPASGPFGAACAKLGRVGCTPALCRHAGVRHGPRGLSRPDN